MQKIGPETTAILILASMLLAVPASAMPAVSLATSSRGDVVMVGGHHCNRISGGGHHNNHGSDSYYDDHENMGVLFKSFVTGTLFAKSDEDGKNKDAPPPKRF